MIPKNLNESPNGSPAHAPKTVDTTISSYKDVAPNSKRASQASKDKVKIISDHFGDDKQGLMNAIEGMGFNIGANHKDWTTSYESHLGIKFMRAKEALSLHAEDGVDILHKFQEYQKTHNSMVQSTTQEMTHTSQAFDVLKTTAKKIVTKLIGRMFSSITDTNMFFSGHPGFNSQKAVKGSMHQRWNVQLINNEFKSLNQYTRHSRDLNRWLRGLYETSKYYGPHFWSMWGNSITEYDFFKKQTKKIITI